MHHAEQISSYFPDASLPWSAVEEMLRNELKTRPAQTVKLFSAGLGKTIVLEMNLKQQDKVTSRLYLDLPENTERISTTEPIDWDVISLEDKNNLLNKIEQSGAN